MAAQVEVRGWLGNPVKNVKVEVYMDGKLYWVDYTNENGIVNVDIPENKMFTVVVNDTVVRGYDNQNVMVRLSSLRLDLTLSLTTLIGAIGVLIFALKK
jgi:hypothetical protein